MSLRKKITVLDYRFLSFCVSSLIHVDVFIMTSAIGNSYKIIDFPLNFFINPLNAWKINSSGVAVVFFVVGLIVNYLPLRITRRIR